MQVDLETHRKLEHMNVSVEIKKEEQQILQCDQCDSKFILNIQLKKHLENKHKETLKYACNTCEYGSNFIAELWNHVLDVHPGDKFQFDQNAKHDILYNLVAEQNVDVLEQFNILNEHMEEASKKLALVFDDIIKDIKEELKEKITSSIQETKNLSNRISSIEVLINKKQEGDKEEVPLPESSKAETPEEESESNKEKKKERQQKRKSRNIEKHKLTWVGTSISKALDRKKFEKDMNVDLTVVKAYCIKEEGRFKKANFAAIVPEIVQKGDLDTLVLQTGSIEITNLEVNKAMMDTTKDISEYKKEWFAKAEKDSENLYMIAEEAIAKNANLNVVIVKRLSRFDRPSSDILGVKTQLSKFANHVYDQLWLKNGSPERIYIVQLDLGCDKYSNLKTIIIGNHEHPKYDGIHLVGNAAVRHFTYRAVQAILPIVTQPYSSHQSPKGSFPIEKDLKFGN